MKKECKKKHTPRITFESWISNYFECPLYEKTYREKRTGKRWREVELIKKFNKSNETPS